MLTKFSPQILCILTIDFYPEMVYTIIKGKGIDTMTPVEMRKAKSELHALIITKVFAFSVDPKEDAELFQYVVELASREMLECVKELEENGND